MFKNEITYPLCVTSVWRNPNLRNMSTTVSIGVWSVMVMGARSKIFSSLKGGGLWGANGDCGLVVNKTSELFLRPVIVRLAFSAEKKTRKHKTYKKGKNWQNEMHKLGTYRVGRVVFQLQNELNLKKKNWISIKWIDLPTFGQSYLHISLILQKNSNSCFFVCLFISWCKIFLRT